MSPHTRILFPRPSFLEGIARIFDIAGALNLYNRSRTPAEADFRAMEADWAAVNADLWAAVEQAEAELVRAAQSHADTDDQAA